MCNDISFDQNLVKHIILIFNYKINYNYSCFFASSCWAIFFRNKHFYARKLENCTQKTVVFTIFIKMCTLNAYKKCYNTINFSFFYY